MITARTNQELSEQEIKVFGQFCLDHGIKTDTANIELLANYLERWNVVIDPDSLEKATQILRDAGQLQFYSAAETRYRKIAAQEPERAAQLAHWFENFNKTLVKTGDELWENQAALLVELHGREVNSPNVHAAIGRLSTKGLIHFVPVERKRDPRQHVDDGKQFLHEEKNPRFKNGRIDHAYQPEAKQEAQKADTPDQSGWQEMCQKYLGHGPHSRQAEFLAIYMKPGLSYREKYSELQKLKSNYERVGRI